MRPFMVGQSSALTRQLTSEAEGGTDMYKNNYFKRIIIMVICIIMITGGTVEAMKPAGVPEKQEERGIVLLNLTRLGINPSLRYALTREEVIEKNKLNNDEVLKEEKTSYSEEDIDLLARLVHAEAKGEGYNGKVAVAATVLNRVESDAYPETIKGVIYEYNYGYQYCPVRNGQINRPTDEQSRKAVREALRGKDPTGGALSFYNPAKSYNRWIRNRPYAATIGNHVFVK